MDFPEATHGRRHHCPLIRARILLLPNRVNGIGIRQVAESAMKVTTVTLEQTLKEKMQTHIGCNGTGADSGDEDDDDACDR